MFHVVFNMNWLTTKYPNCFSMDVLQTVPLCLGLMFPLTATRGQHRTVLFWLDKRVRHMAITTYSLVSILSFTIHL